MIRAITKAAINSAEKYAKKRVFKDFIKDTCHACLKKYCLELLYGLYMKNLKKQLLFEEYKILFMTKFSGSNI